MVKLSGFAKFDLDTKITKKQFFHLIEETSMIEQTEQPKVDTNSEQNEAKPEDGEAEPVVTKVFCPDTYDMIREAWGSALTGTNPPFTGKLEDPCYLKIV